MQAYNPSSCCGQKNFHGMMKNMGQLKDQVAIVTGGSSGIGLAIARAFVQEGMRVTIAARDKRRLDQAASRLKSRSAGDGTVLAVQTDVSQATEVQQSPRLSEA